MVLPDPQAECVLFWDVCASVSSGVWPDDESPWKRDFCVSLVPAVPCCCDDDPKLLFELLSPVLILIFLYSTH